MPARRPGPRSPLVVCFVGYSGSGKTSLIERLLPLLRRRGIVAACAKHHHGPASRPKDTDRHIDAGASAALLVGAKTVSLSYPSGRPESLARLAVRHLGRAPLVLAEGFSAESLPRVAVVSPASPRLRPGRGPLLAAVGWTGRALGVPVFDSTQAPLLADLLARLVRARRRSHPRRRVQRSR